MTTESDTLNDDAVKLVHYAIVSIDRDRERILRNGEGYEIVTDDMSVDGFSSWIIARYFQRPDHEELSQDEKRYLRVCREVLCRWPRGSLGFESKELARLAGIERAIRSERERRRLEREAGSSSRGASPASRPSPAPPTPRRPRLSADRRRVLAALEERGGSATIGQLRSDLDREWGDVRKDLEALEEAGRVSQSGAGATAKYRLEEAG